jgi:hypothetical protein
MTERTDRILLNFNPDAGPFFLTLNDTDGTEVAKFELGTREQADRVREYFDRHYVHRSQFTELERQVAALRGALEPVAQFVAALDRNNIGDTCPITIAPERLSDGLCAGDLRKLAALASSSPAVTEKHLDSGWRNWIRRAVADLELHNTEYGHLTPREFIELGKTLASPTPEGERSGDGVRCLFCEFAGTKAALIEHSATCAKHPLAQRACKGIADTAHLESVLINVAQIFDGWCSDGSWTEWDRSVRADVSELIAALAAHTEQEGRDAGN